MDTLLLTTEEQKKFNALPAALREEWKVEGEMLASFETAKQLQMRFHMSSLKKYPAFRALAAKAQAGEKIDPKTYLATFDEEMLPEVFFLIGAKGLTLLIENVLGVAKTDDELKAAAAWSHVRHDLLKINASIS